ncbi:MAG: hypothetical protein JWO48_3202, partial [Bryobacterales bacterium]|nr:hypothetical protein [Bryobacterales bacterium]
SATLILNSARKLANAMNSRIPIRRNPTTTYHGSSLIDDFAWNFLRRRWAVLERSGR